MPDVTFLQTLLDGGVTNPAVIYAALPTAETHDELHEAITMLSKNALADLNQPAWPIPNDDQEHPCACGKADYRVHMSSWVGLLVIDVEGRQALFCHECGRELEVGR